MDLSTGRLTYVGGTSTATVTDQASAGTDINVFTDNSFGLVGQIFGTEAEAVGGTYWGLGNQSAPLVGTAGNNKPFGGAFIASRSGIALTPRGTNTFVLTADEDDIDGTPSSGTNATYGAASGTRHFTQNGSSNAVQSAISILSDTAAVDATATATAVTAGNAAGAAIAWLGTALEATATATAEATRADGTGLAQTFTAGYSGTGVIEYRTNRTDSGTALDVASLYLIDNATADRIVVTGPDYVAASKTYLAGQTGKTLSYAGRLTAPQLLSDAYDTAHADTHGFTLDIKVASTTSATFNIGHTHTAADSVTRKFNIEAGNVNLNTGKLTYVSGTSTATVTDQAADDLTTDIDVFKAGTFGLVGQIFGTEAEAVGGTYWGLGNETAPLVGTADKDKPFGGAFIASRSGIYPRNLFSLQAAPGQNTGTNAVDIDGTPASGTNSTYGVGIGTRARTQSRGVDAVDSEVIVITGNAGADFTAANGNADLAWLSTALETTLSPATGRGDGTGAAQTFTTGYSATGVIEYRTNRTTGTAPNTTALDVASLYLIDNSDADRIVVAGPEYASGTYLAGQAGWKLSYAGRLTAPQLLTGAHGTAHADTHRFTLDIVVVSATSATFDIRHTHTATGGVTRKFNITDGAVDFTTGRLTYSASSTHEVTDQATAGTDINVFKDNTFGLVGQIFGDEADALGGTYWGVGNDIALTAPLVGDAGKGKPFGGAFIASRSGRGPHMVSFTQRDEDEFPGLHENAGTVSGLATGTSTTIKADSSTDTTWYGVVTNGVEQFTRDANAGTNAFLGDIYAITDDTYPNTGGVSRYEHGRDDALDAFETLTHNAAMYVAFFPTAPGELNGTGSLVTVVKQIPNPAGLTGIYRYSGRYIAQAKPNVLTRTRIARNFSLLADFTSDTFSTMDNGFEGSTDRNGGFSSSGTIDGSTGNFTASNFKLNTGNPSGTLHGKFGGQNAQAVAGVFFVPITGNVLNGGFIGEQSQQFLTVRNGETIGTGQAAFGSFKAATISTLGVVDPAAVTHEFLSSDFAELSKTANLQEYIDLFGSRPAATGDESFTDGTDTTSAELDSRRIPVTLSNGTVTAGDARGTLYRWRNKEVTSARMTLYSRASTRLLRVAGPALSNIPTTGNWDFKGTLIGGTPDTLTNASTTEFTMKANFTTGKFTEFVSTANLGDSAFSAVGDINKTTGVLTSTTATFGTTASPTDIDVTGNLHQDMSKGQAGLTGFWSTKNAADSPLIGAFVGVGDSVTAVEATSNLVVPSAAPATDCDDACKMNYNAENEIVSGGYGYSSGEYQYVPTGGTKPVSQDIVFISPTAAEDVTAANKTSGNVGVAWITTVVAAIPGLTNKTDSEGNDVSRVDVATTTRRFTFNGAEAPVSKKTGTTIKTGTHIKAYEVDGAGIYFIDAPVVSGGTMDRILVHGEDYVAGAYETAGAASATRQLSYEGRLTLPKPLDSVYDLDDTTDSKRFVLHMDIENYSTPQAKPVFELRADDDTDGYLNAGYRIRLRGTFDANTGVLTYDDSLMYNDQVSSENAFQYGSSFGGFTQKLEDIGFRGQIYGDEAQAVGGVYWGASWGSEMEPHGGAFVGSKCTGTASTGPKCNGQ